MALYLARRTVGRNNARQANALTSKLASLFLLVYPSQYVKILEYKRVMKESTFTECRSFHLPRISPNDPVNRYLSKYERRFSSPTRPHPSHPRTSRKIAHA